MVIQMFVSDYNSYVEIITPKVMAFEGRAFGRSPGHEGRTLVNGSVLLEERPQRVPSPLPPCEDTAKNL